MRQPSAHSSDAIVEHRRQVRSLLAVIRAIVHRSSTSAMTVDDYVAHLSGRLDALSRVQDIIMRDPGATVDLQELLAEEFLRQGIPPDKVTMSAEPLLLHRSVAAVLALALHELATNTVKFGDLEEPSRIISIQWFPRPEHDGWMVLEWRERAATGNGAVAGFGFELIRRMLPYEIGARTSIELTAHGLVCEIMFSPTGNGS